MTVAVRRAGGPGRARVAAAVSRYDVFLLDEPTNDLDLDGLDRLERFVAGLRAGTVVVSHDREFLTRTVNRVLELDLAQQQVRLYGGGYDGVPGGARGGPPARPRGVRGVRRHPGRAARRGPATQRAWMEKGVRNARRKATDNDKIGRKFRAEATEKQAAKAGQTERLIERLEVVEEPRKEWELRMEIAAAPRAGAVVAIAAGARSSRRGAFTLGPVDLQIDWADRVAITGANGSGKSTLLGALLGRLPLTAGAGHARPGRGGRRGRPGPRAVPRRRSRCWTRSGRRCRDWRRRRRADPAGQVRPALGARAAAGGDAVPGRADPGRAGAAAGPRGQPAGAGRADQPSRPAGHRAARVGAGRATPARCCWSPTTGGCSTRCTPTGG